MAISIKSYKHFPPIENFKKVLKIDPTVLETFIGLHSLIPQFSKSMKFKRESVPDMFNITPTLLKNHLMILEGMEVLSFYVNQNGFCISLEV